MAFNPELFLKKGNIKKLANPRYWLWGNKTEKQTIAKNTIWLALSDFFSNILKLILFIFAARILGANGYGQFSFALAFSGLLGFISDLGISKIANREFSQNKEKEKDFNALFSLKILLAFLTSIVIFTLSFWATSDIFVRKIIWALAIFSASEGLLEIFFAFFQSRQRMEFQASIEFTRAVLIASIGFLTLLFAPSTKNFSLAYLLSSLIALLIVFLFFHFKFSPIKFSIKYRVWKDYLVLSWPLVLNSILGRFYLYFDSVLLGHLGQISQTGFYGAAQKIAVVSTSPASLIAPSFFPALSSLFKESKQKFQKIWSFYFQVIIFFVIPVVFGGLILAKPLISTIYGKGFLASVLALQILLISRAFLILSDPFSQAILISNNQKSALKISCVAVFLNLALNIILIPKFSLYGACFAGLANFASTFILCFLFVRKNRISNPITKEILKTFLVSILSSFAMIFIIFLLLGKTELIFLVLIGMACYFIFSFAFWKFFKKQKIEK